MSKTIRFATTAEIKAKYMTNFRSKSVDYLTRYISSYERFIGKFKDSFEGSPHSDPLEIIVTREVLEEKSAPRHAEPSDGGC